MKRYAGILIGCAILAMAAYAADNPAPAAPADEPHNDLGGYQKLRCEEVGVMICGFDGSIDRLGEGVKIVLLSDDPEKKPLPISAREMKFTWGKDAKKPNRIMMEGKVAIDHPQATVRADKADWELEKGMLTFTGSPVITTEQVPQGIEGQKVILDFNKNKFEVYGGKAKEIKFGEGMTAAAASAPNAAAGAGLQESDIADWPKFLDTVRKQAAGSEASPGKQLVSLLDPKVQKLLTTTPVDTLLADKGAILKQINRVLANPKFYNPAAWKGVKLDDAVQQLIGQGAQAPAAQLNRLLLEAAFPGVVAAGSKQ